MMGLLHRSYKSVELSSNFIVPMKRLQTNTELRCVRLPRVRFTAYASQKSVRRARNRQSEQILKTDGDAPDESTNVSESERKKDSVQEDSGTEMKNDSGLDIIPSRDNVLWACSVTSSLIAALGLTIRQVSHIASLEGLPIFDCSVEPSFTFEIWHIEVTAGLVVIVSSCRYVLMKLWPEFEESSQAANQQILTSLEPLDYIIVSFLPGFSEELLFRGALLPQFGFNSLSALGVGALFGILHLGNGRKYSFAVWATFVGFVYGYATIATSSIIVPMSAHALNNLVGGLVWRLSTFTRSK